MQKLNDYSCQIYLIKGFSYLNTIPTQFSEFTLLHLDLGWLGNTVSKSNSHTNKKMFLQQKTIYTGPKCRVRLAQVELLQTSSQGVWLLLKQQKLQFSLLTSIRYPKPLPLPTLIIKSLGIFKKEMHIHQIIIDANENNFAKNHIDLLQDFAAVNFATATQLNIQSWGGNM